MRAITKHRTERLRSNVQGPAELCRLAAWYAELRAKVVR